MRYYDADGKMRLIDDKTGLAVTHDMVQNAIRIILNDKANYAKTLNYAVNYARAATSMVGDDLRVQCLYILGNITRWRHPEAKNVRAVLKAYR